MDDKDTDLLARYDEKELIELTEADTNGGTGWGCAIVTAVATLVSAVACPTTKCTSKC